MIKEMRKCKLILMLALAVFCAQAVSAVTVMVKKGTTTWTDVWIYNYVGGANAECGPWPGIKLSPNLDGWYSYTFTGTIGNVIFNDGVGNLGSTYTDRQWDASFSGDVCFIINSGGLTAAACSSGPEPYESKHNRVIYEVNVRNFSSSGNFNGLKNDLTRLKNLGVEILWLMPIHPIGVKNRVGAKGSPYSVQDYKAINPDYGNATDLKALVQAAHDNGMEIWLDWVANHTAWDHVWNVPATLNYYASSGGTRPYSPNGWNDVIQLDFNNAGMKAAMIDAMKYWVTEFDIDGFRCDYVSGVPVSFWNDARAQVNAIKTISWLAESDNAGYMTAFDYDYAWNFSDQLNTFGTNSSTTGVSSLITACENLINNSSYNSKSRMIYLTNHDLNADSGTEFTRYGDNVYPLTVLLFTIYGMPLLYNGQEIGANKSMSLFNVSTVPWTPVNTTMSDLIKKMITLKRTQPALEDGPNKGSYKKYTTNNSSVYAYSRTKGDNEVLVLLNFSTSGVSFNFSGTAPSGEFVNYFESGEVTFSTSTAVSIPAKGYKVFVKNGGTFPPDDPDDPDDSDKITVHWKQVTGMNWTNMYIYNYISGADAECGTWPGMPVTKDVDGWYSYTFSGDPGNLIWNNGGTGTGNQLDGPYGEEANNCFEISTTAYAVVECEMTVVGTEQINNKFTIYPNPANQHITIDAQKPIRSVSITDMRGAQLFAMDNPENTERMDIKQLTPGFYIIKILWENETITLSKLIKI